MPSRTANAVATAKPTDEKAAINLGCVDLGQIELLVQEGFYANRTDLIRTTICNRLTLHSDVVKQGVARKTPVQGIPAFHPRQAARRAGVGLSPADTCFGPGHQRARCHPRTGACCHRFVVLLGALHASAALKAALAGRIR